MMPKVPDFQDFFLAQAQYVVFEGDELNIFIAICFGELDGLIEVFSFFDELESEEVASRFDFLELDLFLGFGGGR